MGGLWDPRLLGWLLGGSSHTDLCIADVLCCPPFRLSVLFTNKTCTFETNESIIQDSAAGPASQASWQVEGSRQRRAEEEACRQVGREAVPEGRQRGRRGVGCREAGGGPAEAYSLLHCWRKVRCMHAAPPGRRRRRHAGRSAARQAATWGLQAGNGAGRGRRRV